MWQLQIELDRLDKKVPAIGVAASLCLATNPTTPFCIGRTLLDLTLFAGLT